MSKIDLSKIEIDKITEGYLWLSDDPDPIVDLKDIKEKLNQTNDSSNPFIIEGQLYGKEAKISYSIKYVDGKHLVAEYDLASMGDYDSKRFVANRIPEKTHICFHQYWKESPEGDPLCEGMKVLQPDAFVFVGFDKKEEEK